jgi:hypothetical protein
LPAQRGRQWCRVGVLASGGCEIGVRN